MRTIRSEEELASQVLEGKREARAAFGKDEVYLEKLVENARHVEVQVLGDAHGNLVHLFERDCSIQRRNQKVVERAPAPYLTEDQREAIAADALKIAGHVAYRGAGTVEFLQDAGDGQHYFIEVNPRVQVEHTVTEEVTGIDIVKAQIRIAEGEAIGTPASGVPEQSDITLNGHAIQCRITTEDPEQNFIPDYGRITAYRGATGFGIRLDGGTAYSGAGHHALLRPAAREGDGLGADARGGDRPHGPRPARVPHPRRGDQPDVPGGHRQPPGLPGARLHDQVHRPARPSCSRPSSERIARRSS